MNVKAIYYNKTQPSPEIHVLENSYFLPLVFTLLLTCKSCISKRTWRQHMGRSEPLRFKRIQDWTQGKKVCVYVCMNVCEDHLRSGCFPQYTTSIKGVPADCKQQGETVQVCVCVWLQVYVCMRGACRESCWATWLQPWLGLITPSLSLSAHLPPSQLTSSFICLFWRGAMRLFSLN